MFPSFRANSSDKLSHRSHRNKNAVCLREQQRLKSEHVAAGNSDELNFDELDDEEGLNFMSDGGFEETNNNDEVACIE
jgi:hypothetical protein